MDINDLKPKDMRYDPSRGRYIGKDGSELRVTPYSNGQGYKFDYYDRDTYGNEKHSTVHVTSDLNENWDKIEKDINGHKTTSSGSGCYLTTACMENAKENFDDNCYELTILRWFRDNFVSEQDIAHYYQTAPIIVNAIDRENDSNRIYKQIYQEVIAKCVNAIENENYDFAYERYQNSILALEEKYAKPLLGQKLVKVLKKSL